MNYPIQGLKIYFVPDILVTGCQKKKMCMHKNGQTDLNIVSEKSLPAMAATAATVPTCYSFYASEL